MSVGISVDLISLTSGFGGGRRRHSSVVECKGEREVSIGGSKSRHLVEFFCKREQRSGL